jgi:hypothetical protein
MRVRVVTAQSVGDFSAMLEREAGGFSLALMFADSLSHDFTALRTAIARTGLEAFGASSAGEIADGAVLGDSIAAALIDLPRETFQIRAFPCGDADALALGLRVGAWVSGTFDDPAILLHQSGGLLDGEALLRGIVDGIGRVVPIFGGRAATTDDLMDTMSFDHRTVIGQGIVALVFDRAHIRIDAAAAAGWRPIGTPKRVTRAEGNRIYELDGMAAREVISHYLPIAHDIIQVSPQHPLHILRPDGTSVLRSPLRWDKEDGSVLLAGTVPEGSLASFTVSAGQGIREATITETRKLKQRVDRAELLILYSCLGRLMALGPIIEDEVADIQGLWDAPTIGFFTLGEFGGSSGCPVDFHNNTCIVVTLSGPEPDR